MRLEILTERGAQAPDLGKFGMPRSVHADHLVGQRLDAWKLGVEVRVVGRLQVVDEQSRTHRHPVGRGSVAEPVECLDDRGDIDAGEVASITEGTLATAAVVEIERFEHPWCSGHEIDDLCESVIG